MSTIDVVPATPGRFAQVEHALTGGGDGASCQCQWWLLTGREFERTSRAEKEGMLRAEIEGSPPPGLVALIDGVGAGWARVGPRTTQPRLQRTRAFAPNSREPWDDPAVWSVTCFSVRREFRGRGVTRALLAASVDFARAHGARALEAYPIDPTAKKVPVNDLYLGPLSAFLSAGFTEVARSHPHRAVVSLDL